MMAKACTCKTDDKWHACFCPLFDKKHISSLPTLAELEARDVTSKTIAREKLEQRLRRSIEQFTDMDDGLMIAPFIDHLIEDYL